MFKIWWLILLDVKVTIGTFIVVQVLFEVDIYLIYNLYYSGKTLPYNSLSFFERFMGFHITFEKSQFTGKCGQQNLETHLRTVSILKKHEI